MEFRPADRHRFGDVVEMLGPKRRPDALACWCLTYRLGAEATGLDAEARRDRVFEMCGHRPAPGILGYLDGEVVGWAGVAPRSEVAELRNTDTYPVVDGPGTDDAALRSMFEKAGFAEVAAVRGQLGGHLGWSCAWRRAVPGSSVDRPEPFSPGAFTPGACPSRDRSR